MRGERRATSVERRGRAASVETVETAERGGGMGGWAWKTGVGKEARKERTVVVAACLLLCPHGARPAGAKTALACACCSQARRRSPPVCRRAATPPTPPR